MPPASPKGRGAAPAGLIQHPDGQPDGPPGHRVGSPGEQRPESSGKRRVGSPGEPRPESSGKRRVGSPDQQDTLIDEVVRWYGAHRRDLPWRAPDRTPWQVLVSEVMLQQTQVARVLPVYEAWLLRWPTPSACALASPAEVLRLWGRLGYPRRALRLHAAAGAIVERHDGQVPADVTMLRALPGVGEYTAAAVATFAYGQRHAVLDTNVRRVLARLLDGQALPAPTLTRGERDRAVRLLPRGGRASALASVALMELGALVCSARSPACAGCPVRPHCAWWRSGRPASTAPARRQARFEGSQRQVRGAILDTLRGTAEPVGDAELKAAWPDAPTRITALRSLLDDGLLVALRDGRYALPGAREPTGAAVDAHPHRQG
jgi:A/G-specific adenine glycosylase